MGRTSKTNSWCLNLNLLFGLPAIDGVVVIHRLTVGICEVKILFSQGNLYRLTARVYHRNVLQIWEVLQRQLENDMGNLEEIIFYQKLLLQSCRRHFCLRENMK